MTILQALIAARAKIDAPEKWTKGAHARDSEGKVVDILSRNACRFCADGAFRSLGEPWRWWIAREELVRATQLCPAEETEIIRFNDAPATTHADIMALFDRAIATEREKLQPPHA